MDLKSQKTPDYQRLVNAVKNGLNGSGHPVNDAFALEVAPIEEETHVLLCEMG